MRIAAKAAPLDRACDGSCPALNCKDCYLKPATGRCPFKKD